MRELERSGSPAVNSSETIDIEKLINSAEAVGEIKLITKMIPDEEVTFLRHLVDQIRNTAKPSVIALFSVKDSKVNMIVSLTKDLAHSKLDAKNMSQAVATLLDGSAGGRKDLAQGGGRNVKGIERALKTLASLIREEIEKP